MKKLVLSCMVLLFAASMGFAQDKGRADLEQLPQEVQDFVAEHFDGVGIKSAEQEKDMLNFGNGEMYEVVLDNGVKLDFNKAGAITEIESKDNVEIPEAALPGNIYSYVDENYDAYIINWEVDSNDQEVELSDGTDLEFDPEGNFMKVD